MKFIKPTLLTLFVLTTLLCGYIYLKFDSNYAINKAFSSMQEGSYDIADDYLSSLKKNNNPKYYLHMGYLKLAQNQFDDAANYFKSALNLQVQPSLRYEIGANLALIALVEKNYDLLESLLTQYPSFENVTQLFQGLLGFESKDYTFAYDSLSKVTDLKVPSRWLQRELDKRIPAIDRLYYLSYSMIENNDPYHARQKIEKFLEANSIIDERFNFLLGKTYLKEAENKPLTLALPYYKTAFQYFKQTPFWDPSFNGFKEQISVEYQKVISKILNEEAYEELNSFLDILGHLDTKIEPITQLFLTHIQKEADLKNQVKLLELTKQTLAYCHNAPFKEKLAETLYFYIQNLTKHRQVEMLKTIWPIYSQISQKKDADKTALSKEVCQSLIDQLETDDAQLITSIPLMQILNTLELSVEQRLYLLQVLTPKIEALWLKDGEKAWAFARQLDELVFADQSELFHEYMHHILGLIQSQVNMRRYSFASYFKEANNYFR